MREGRCVRRDHGGWVGDEQRAVAQRADRRLHVIVWVRRDPVHVHFSRRCRNEAQRNRCRRCSDMHSGAIRRRRCSPNGEGAVRISAHVEEKNRPVAARTKIACRDRRNEGCGHDGNLDGAAPRADRVPPPRNTVVEPRLRVEQGCAERGGLPLEDRQFTAFRNIEHGSSVGTRRARGDRLAPEGRHDSETCHRQPVRVADDGQCCRSDNGARAVLLAHATARQQDADRDPGVIHADIVTG